MSGDIKSEKISKKVILQIARAFEVNEQKKTILNQRANFLQVSDSSEMKNSLVVHENHIYIYIYMGRKKHLIYRWTDACPERQ